ncbi:MAG: HAD hydrolase family protein [Deltaproteobacteria bacterium]|nr:HAD hydrolase family protein [Deltaproteobacteria bacterium]
MKDLKNIKLVVIDVDGVLTDGSIIVDEEGKEQKFFDVKDGHLIHMAIDAGLKVVWVSGRYSKATDRRALATGIHLVLQNQRDKVKSLNIVKEKFKVSETEMAYIGDDLIDIPPMSICAFSAAPCDAVEEVKEKADYISPYGGGKGAVRDILKLILKSKGMWEKLVQRYCGVPE